MSLLIAICDDEMKVCASLEAMLIDLCNQLNIPCEIDVFFTGEEVCQKMKAGATYDLMFLDIEFIKTKVSGIEVGKFIRNACHNNAMSIVYISWHTKYAMQLFNIRPLDFLVKPLDRLKIEHTLNTYLKLAGFWSGNFTYRVGHDTLHEKIKNIVYFESIGRKLVIYLVGGRKEEFYGALKEVYHQQLEKYDFLFIHAKYVINYDYINHMKYHAVSLFNCHTTLPISQPRRKDVRTRYIHILDKRRRWRK